MNTTGLLLTSDSYSNSSLDATSNYWDSSSGPNYNGDGPGNGELITDNNIPGVQTVNYSNFATFPYTCSSPLTINKTTSSVNVIPGNPVSFNILFNVNTNITFELISFIDLLPNLNSKYPWVISSQNPPGTFVITGTIGSQELKFANSLPISLSNSTYSVTISANTNMSDAGDILENTINATIQLGSDDSIIQTIVTSATASVAVCIHGSSMIMLANGDEIEISKIEPGTEILAADGTIISDIEVVSCYAGVNNKLYGTCIIFEQNSLGNGFPSRRLAIDAGHPMSDIITYKNNGNKCLIPAKFYLDHAKNLGNKNIYSKSWDDIAPLMSGNNLRYDIIMPNDSCQAYFANGVVVKSRQNRKNPGYNYE